MLFNPLMSAVKDHFFTSAALGRAVAMTQAESQPEGWWKAELFMVFRDLQARKHIKAWSREVPTGRGRERVDFMVELASANALVEVKTALCGMQKNEAWTLPMYVQGPKNGFLLTDILKLGELAAPKRYLLVFAFAAAPSTDWQKTLTEIRKKAPTLAVDLVRLDSAVGNALSIGWFEVASHAPAS